MPTEQYVFLILYIHSIYGILYMYTTKYSCVFLKLCESIYVAMGLIPILLGSLPLAHNAQHSLVYVFMYIYIYIYIYYSEALDERHRLVVYTAYTPASW